MGLFIAQIAVFQQKTVDMRLLLTHFRWYLHRIFRVY